MKVLHVVKKYPGALGGDAVVVSQLKKQEEAAGHEVRVLTSRCRELLPAAGVYTFGLQDTSSALDAITIRRLISLLMLGWKAFLVLLKERPQVIHTHSVDMAFVVSFAAKSLGIPIVHTFHIVTFYDAEQSKLRRLSELLLVRLSGAKVITAPNSHDVQMLNKRGLPAQLLPNGIDLAFWHGKARPKENAVFTFVSVGRLEKQKGYLYLIQAVSLLAASTDQPFRVLIIGSGSLQQQIESAITSYGLSEHIQYIGQQDPKEVRRLFNTADAAVFPALYETTPLTLLEAWACQLPVVITSVGLARSDYFKDAVFSAAVADAESLKQAMLACMANKELRLQKQEKGRAHAERFAWPSVAQTALDLYRRVL